MTWTSLKTRLDAPHAPIPPVLAGPMLRKVTPFDVTVWFATRYAATITVRVFGPDGQVFEGSRHTTRIGANLYIVAVTAIPLPEVGTLEESTIYEYDAVFHFDQPSIGQLPIQATMTLEEATDHASLSYLPSKRPSFCLPPTDVNKLRILHGSCRHTNGETSKDMLASIDRLIAQAALVADQRPHQLLLMGDQIYADDVGGDLLLLLTDASDALLDWQENLPVPRDRRTWTADDLANPLTRKGNQIPPYARTIAAGQAKLTSDEPWNHIMTLGEYICMYLFSWSDVLWAERPTHADVKAAVDALSRDDDQIPPGLINQSQSLPAMRIQDLLGVKRDEVDDDIENLKEFRRRMLDVRRALANIPTYMILDDHEVTDDFNMTRDIAVGMYGNPLGRRVIMNALVAYTLCQHWGNVPGQFDEKQRLLPGTQLLEAFEDRILSSAPMDAAKYDQQVGLLSFLVGVHDDREMMAAPGGPAAYHNPTSLTFNYTIEGPGHQIIVTDTRTWRAFPNGGGGAPVLLPQSQIDEQIGNTPSLNRNGVDRALIVVVSTNAPPIPIIRWTTRNPWKSNHAKFFPDIYDSWELPSFPLDRLLKALTDKLPKVNGGVASGPIVLLSGDTHMSFASRLLFTATSRLGDPSPGVAVKSVVAQLVSSSFRNPTSDTRDAHRHGYDLHYTTAGGRHRPEAHVGWNVTTPEHVMDRHLIPGATFEDSIVHVTLHASRTVPVRVIKRTDTATYLRTPDWGYRFDYLTATLQDPFPVTTKTLPPIPSGATEQQRKDAADLFKQVVGDYKNFSKRNTNRQIVGVTNASELTFDWPAGDKKRVFHTVRWHDPDDDDRLLATTYAVSLDPNDPDFTFESVAGVKVGP